MTARKRKPQRKAKAKRKSPRPARTSRAAEQRRLLLEVQKLRAAVDRLVKTLERTALGPPARTRRVATPTQTRDLERAFDQLSAKQRFPFGLWRSSDPQQRWSLDFSDNGCEWVERNASGTTLRRQVELVQDGGAWIIHRPNDAEVLAFLGATRQLSDEILARSPQPSFIRVDLNGDQIHGEWNGLRWTVDANAHLKSLEQPGSTPATISVFSFDYLAGSDDIWFRPDATQQLTFDQEGQEGTRFHSRWLQWPGGSSGVTLGRGHDLKERAVATATSELIAAGLTPAQAAAFAAGATLSGTDARDFVSQRRAICGNITPAQQLRLFRADYAALEADARRICQKSDVVAKYGAVDFTTLDARIWSVVVDLRFRGDYTPASRALLQKAIADNDLARFRTALSKTANWTGVPAARFNARVAALA